MITKDKNLGYWLRVIISTITVLGLVAVGWGRIMSVERKASKMPAVEWDIRVMKQVLSRVYPAVYDSVISNEVRINGTRPLTKED